MRAGSSMVFTGKARRARADYCLAAVAAAAGNDGGADLFAGIAGSSQGRK